jgi:septal ring factor EnvC (AmiA/AmiB activator)
MISSDDSPGVFTFMVGLILVVFTGVALSLLVDRKFSFSKRVSGLAGQIEAGATELEQLKVTQLELESRLTETEPKRRALMETRTSLDRKLPALTTRRKSLTDTMGNLKQTLPALEAEFARYRSAYRDAARAAAVGESLGTLTVRGGREYRQAVINRVTDVGLEIRHENGIARVQAPELDQAMQDRFQWEDEARRAKLNEENAAHLAMEDTPTPPEKPTRRTFDSPKPKDRTPDADAAKIESLRSKVIVWKTRVSHLKSERSQAVGAASYSSQSSVPGSLETWQAKSARLGSELAKASGELAVAKAALAAAAPSDPLLRPDPGSQ